MRQKSFVEKKSDGWKQSAVILEEVGKTIMFLLKTFTLLPGADNQPKPPKPPSGGRIRYIAKSFAN